jgi:hypothetical protein
MNKLFRLATAAVLVCVLVPVSVSAHVLKTDGSMGVELHVDPDDHPIVGTPTEYILSFEDSRGKFDLANCDCDVFISEKGKTISVTSMNVTGRDVSENKYTFKTPDTYTLRATGTPKTPGGFQPFSLDYTVQVSDNEVPSQDLPPLLWVGLAGGIGVVLLGAYAFSRDTNKKKPTGRATK